MIIYFDNAATTKLSEKCIASSELAMKVYGNPSSMHNLGLEAENLIKKTTKIVCLHTGMLPSEIIYTSGGTESNNCAIFSSAYKARIRGKRIITTKSEHPSVLSCIKELESNGFEIVYLNQDKFGNINIDELYEAVNKETLLVSIAHVNSETGVIQPIEDMASAVKKKNEYTLFHTDIAQSFGKLDTNKFLNLVDYMSLSAHKIHALKGCGMLYVKKGAPIKPLIYGGGQQQDRRSGTENTIGIASFGEAVQNIFSKTKENYKIVQEIKKYIIDSCVSDENSVFVNGDIDKSSPYILNLSVLGIRSEVLLHALENEGIYVSSGSACSSRQKTSGVLDSYGIEKQYVESAVRLSFCGDNTLEEAHIFADKFLKLVSNLRKHSGIKNSYNTKQTKRTMRLH